MGDAPDDWVVIYRGGSVAALDLLEAMLTAEGFEPRRLGRASPALLGTGESAVVQMITVRAQHAAAARALLEASSVASQDPGDIADLEEQAMRARPLADTRGVVPDGPSIGTAVLLVLAVLLGYLWLRP